MSVVSLRDEQVRKVLAAIGQKNPLGYRDYCLVLILLDTGVRLSELVNLKLDDIDLERGQFKVMGKGWKERIVPFGANVQRAIWRYVHQYRPKPFHPGIKDVFTLEIVRNYVNLASGDVAAVHRRFSPMDLMPPKLDFIHFPGLNMLGWELHQPLSYHNWRRSSSPAM